MSRIARAGIAAAGIALLAIIALWSSRRDRTPGWDIPRASLAPAGQAHVPASREPKDPAGTEAASARIAKARRILGKRLLTGLDRRMIKDATIPHPSSYRFLVFSEPGFRRLLAEVQSELGDDFPEAARTLYGELESPAYRCVLLLMMGSGRAGACAPLLKSAASGGGEPRIACAASYALGLLGTDEARAFLSDQYRSLFGRQEDRDRGDLKEIVEAGLSVCGEKAVPLLLEQARAELAAEDAEEGPPAADERFLISDGMLAGLRVDRVSPELKDRILLETDPRLRSSMLVALARNASPDVYRFLAETAEQEVRHRGDVLRAVARTMGNDEVTGADVLPLRDSLGRIFRQFDPGTLKDPLDLASFFALGCRLGGPGELERIRPLLRLDFESFTREAAPDLRDAIAYWLGRTPGGGKMFEEFLDGVPDEETKIRMLAAFRRHPDSPVNDPAEIRRLVDAMEKQETIDEKINLNLWVLSRATTEKETVLSAFRGAYERSATQAPRAAIADKAADLGSASAPFLERILAGEDGAVVRALAARRLLEFLPEAEVKGRLAAHYSALLVPVDPVTNDDFRGSRTLAYCDLVRDYYSRFGTRADLPTLDALAGRVKLARDLDESVVRFYRDFLRDQCRQAKDAILLRLGSSE